MCPVPQPVLWEPQPPSRMITHMPQCLWVSWAAGGIGTLDGGRTLLAGSNTIPAIIMYYPGRATFCILREKGPSHVGNHFVDWPHSLMEMLETVWGHQLITLPLLPFLLDVEPNQGISALPRQQFLKTVEGFQDWCGHHRTDCTRFIPGEKAPTGILTPF